MPDYDPILTSRRYVLAEDADGYAIWERGGGDDPLERFPETEEGFDAAERRFRELRRTPRRTSWQMVVSVVIVAGLALWIVGGIGFGLLTTFSIRSPLGISLPLLVDTAGFRLAAAGILALGAIVLLRLERRTRSEGDAPSAGPWQPAAPSRWSRPLVTALLVGLVTWILSGILTQALVPYVGFGRAPSTAQIASQLIEALSFRVWIAALVLLLLPRVRGDRHSAPLSKDA